MAITASIRIRVKTPQVRIRHVRTPKTRIRALPRLIPIDGEDGVSPTIAVGTVTTGAAGSSAVVTNVGTPEAAIFDFIIPQGDDGANGAPGVVQSLVGGTNVTIDATDPANPIVNAAGGDAADVTFTPAGNIAATDVQAAIEELDSEKAALSHTHTASQVTDFDTEVSNNTDVAANTAARHAAVTVADSAEIDLTLSGQQISASIVAGSIDETKLDTSVNASLDLADSAVQPNELVFNVKDYGAVGDGANNDAPAIRSAIAAALSSGGGVFIPEGTYALGSVDPVNSSAMVQQVSSGSSLTIRGAGREKAVLEMDGTFGAQVINCLDLDGVHLEGFSIDCTGQTAGGGILVTDCDNVYIDVKVSNSFNNGILIDGAVTGCDNVVINRPHVLNAGGHGVALSGDESDGTGVRVTNCRILHPYVLNPTNSGINVSEAKKVLVDHPIVIHDGSGGAHATGYGGIRCTNGTEQVTIRNPQVDGMDRGIFASKVYGYEILGGVLKNCGQQGMFLHSKTALTPAEGALNGRVVGTKIINPGQRSVGSASQYGFYVLSSTGNVFIGVTVESGDTKMTHGIYEAPDCTGNMFPVCKASSATTANYTFASDAIEGGVRNLPQNDAERFLELLSASTSALPTVQAYGSETNIDMAVLGKGTGQVRIGNSNGSHLRVGGSSADNYLECNGGATGNAPAFQAKGVDTNIDVRFVPKGTGYMRFGSYVATPGTITGYIYIRDTGGTLRKLAVTS